MKLKTKEKTNKNGNKRKDRQKNRSKQTKAKQKKQKSNLFIKKTKIWKNRMRWATIDITDFCGRRVHENVCQSKD